MTPEGRVKDAIMTFLRHIPKGLFLEIKNVGTFDPSIMRFRKPSRWFTPGVSDCLGIYRQIPIALEFKSKTGKPTDEQTQFIQRWELAGGVAGIVRGVDDALALIMRAEKIADQRDKYMRLGMERTNQVEDDENDKNDQGVKTE